MSALDPAYVMRVLFHQRVHADAGWSASPIPLVGCFDAAAVTTTYLTLRRSFSPRPGQGRFEIETGERIALARAKIDWSLDHWTLLDLGRAVLLSMSAKTATETELHAVLRSCWKRGDAAAKRSLLRVLPVLPGGPHWAGLAIEATRVASRGVLTALLVDNPYPARHLAEPELERLLARGLEVGITRERVIGLAARASRAS